MQFTEYALSNYRNISKLMAEIKIIIFKLIKNIDFWVGV